MTDILESSAGRQSYPWDLPPEMQHPAWLKQSRLRALAMPCLSMDPATRPSAAQLLSSIHRMSQSTATR